MFLFTGQRCPHRAVASGGKARFGTQLPGAPTATTASNTKYRHTHTNSPMLPECGELTKVAPCTARKASQAKPPFILISIAFHVSPSKMQSFRIYLLCLQPYFFGKPLSIKYLVSAQVTERLLNLQPSGSYCTVYRQSLLAQTMFLGSNHASWLKP